jgi:hypothetical protein
MAKTVRPRQQDAHVLSFIDEAIRPRIEVLSEAARGRALRFEKKIWALLGAAWRERKRKPADAHPIVSDPHFLEAEGELLRALGDAAWDPDIARERAIARVLGPQRKRLAAQTKDPKMTEVSRKILGGMIREADNAVERFPSGRSRDRKPRGHTPAVTASVMEARNAIACMTRDRPMMSRSDVETAVLPEIARRQGISTGRLRRRLARF